MKPYHRIDAPGRHDPRKGGKVKNLYATEEEDPVTRIDSVRAATGSAKDSVLHAAEVVAPYAESAKDRATTYAQEARVALGPKVSQAAHQARAQYDTHLAPRLEQARTHVPPKLDQAAHDARVAFDCIALDEFDRAHTNAITARAAVDAAVTILATALGTGTPGFGDPA